MCHFLSLLHFRPIFDKIRRDSDQRRAADGMLKKPMSVISGRAGTGKTEVAVTVWKAIKEKWDKYELRKLRIYKCLDKLYFVSVRILYTIQIGHLFV